MKLDIYKRAEAGGTFSYLAVPEGKVIPEEATNVDWEDAERGFNFDESENGLSRYAITHPIEQMKEKGYAITSLQHVASQHHQ